MNVNNENMTPDKDNGLNKHLKLKRIKKKKTKFDLNASTNNKFFKSIQSRMNISVANSSVVKASLRANNKALAQSLEKVRHDLRESTEINNGLKRENQDLHLRLINLERVAGLKDESLEKEVQRRIEDKTKQLKQILSSVSVHLLDAGSCLQDALDKCIDPTRLSIASSARHSSLGMSDDAYSPLNSDATSSIYYNPNTFSRVSSLDPQPVRSSDVPADLDNPPEGMLSSRQLQEMTMILEQSVLAEVDDLQSVTEDMNGDAQKDEVVTIAEKEGSPKITKRSSRSSDRSSNKFKETLKANPEIIKSPIRSGSKPTSDQQDRRGTFVVPAPVPQQVDGATGDKAAQDRRGTFVLSKPPQEENASKKASKRGTFVLKSPAITVPPVESKEEEKSVFKVPLPVSNHSEDVPVDQGEDTTVYLNTDMELTEVICLDQTATSATAADAEMEVTESPERVDKGKEKQLEKTEQSKPKPKSKIAKSTSLTAIHAKEKTDPKMSKSDTDISKDKNNSNKSAVVLQLRKPGKIVFSAARKEYDGSRKAIPSKLPSRARSKSKKEMKELKESIAADKSEPKNIFDFHDKTPVHLAEKSRIQPSVYDLSMDESQTSTESTKEKEVKTSGKTEVKSKDPKCDSVSMTYSMPLKGSPEEKKSPNKNRSRSKSGARSKSRKQNSDTESDINEDGKSKPRRGRSKSRARNEQEDADTKDSEEYTVRSRSRSRGQLTRSQSQSRKIQADDPNADESDEENDVIARKSRSRSRKKLPSSDEDTGLDKDPKIKSKTDGKAEAAAQSSNEQIVATGKQSAQKDTSDSDDDFKVSAAQRKSVTSRKGRSKHRKHLDSEDESDPQKTEEPLESTVESTSVTRRGGRAAKLKAISLNKNIAEDCNSDSQSTQDMQMNDTKDDHGKVNKSEDCTRDESKEKEVNEADDNVIVLEDTFLTEDLQPVSSSDFISRISSSNPKTKSSSVAASSDDEESKLANESSKSKRRSASKHSESDDAVEVVTVKSTRTKDRKKTKKLASATDDELEDEDYVNKTSVVPASDDEGGHSEEDTQKAAKVPKKGEIVSGAKLQNTCSTNTVENKEVTNKAKVKASSNLGADSAHSTDASNSKSNEVYSLPLKDNPEPPRGRSRALKKVERDRSRSRKRVDVHDILQAFKDADDPDHSLRLNATGRNDSVVLAEVIRNACKYNDVEEKPVEKLSDLEALAESEQTEVYTLPLKDSPKKSAKVSGRSRSQSRGRSRSKKRVIDSDDEDFEVTKPSKTTKRQRGEMEKKKSNDVEGKIYTLPLKDSPEVPKKTLSRSRSKSRSRSDRGRSRSRKRADSEKKSPNRAQDTASTDASESPAPVRSKSVKKTKTKSSENESRSTKTTPEKSRKKIIADLESPEKEMDAEPTPRKSLNVTFDAQSPADIGKRSVKVTEKSLVDGDTKPTDDPPAETSAQKSTGKKSKKKKDSEDGDRDADQTDDHPSETESKAEKSTGKKSKKGKNSTGKSQQAELKERFNELKRKLSMMPRASDRMSFVDTEKENGEFTLKRKRDSEEKTSVECEKRSRRAAAAGISYKELPVGAKLRRGDPGTSHFFTSDPLKMFKSPLKCTKGGLSQPGVLDNISNTTQEVTETQDS